MHNHMHKQKVLLHSLFQIEGKLRYLANPHAEERMKLILSQLEKREDIEENEEEMEQETDEVTAVYYGERCNCTQNSTS